MLTKILSIIVNPIEAMLKPLKIDVNEFFAYIFAVLSVYFAKILRFFLSHRHSIQPQTEFGPQPHRIGSKDNRNLTE